MIKLDLGHRRSARLPVGADRIATNVDAEAVRNKTVVVQLAQAAARARSMRPPSNEELELLIRGRLEQHPHFRGRTFPLHVESVAGRIVLSGRLPSRYLKQLLHAVICGIPGVVDIDDQVSVMRPNAR